MIPTEMIRKLIRSCRWIIFFSAMNGWLVFMMTRSIDKLIASDGDVITFAIKVVILVALMTMWFLPWIRYLRRFETNLNDKIQRETYETVELLHNKHLFKDTEIDWKMVAEAAEKLQQDKS